MEGNIIMHWDPNRWPNFTPAELACKDGTPFPLHDDGIFFLDCLQGLRTRLGVALILNSAYRSPTHNAAVGGATDSPHVTGEAGDIKCHGQLAYDIIRLAPSFKFTGIGVQQKGPYEGRYIHLDTRTGAMRPRVWSY